RLTQLFENLLRNAVEHGGPDVTVRVGCTDEGTIFVEDDGPGIPPEERDEIFEPGHSSASGGTGFGLTIAKQIVEAHGWTIAATEGTDGGARFELTTTQ
ncbi:MAG: sensor histidine kinase, partial [Halobaculum sp.]